MLKKKIINTVYKKDNQYVQYVRNVRSYDKLLIDPSKVYTIERYHRRNKSFPGLRHGCKIKQLSARGG